MREGVRSELGSGPSVHAGRGKGGRGCEGVGGGSWGQRGGERAGVRVRAPESVRGAVSVDGVGRIRGRRRGLWGRVWEAVSAGRR